MLKIVDVTLVDRRDVAVLVSGESVALGDDVVDGAVRAPVTADRVTDVRNVLAPGAVPVGAGSASAVGVDSAVASVGDSSAGVAATTGTSSSSVAGGGGAVVVPDGDASSVTGDTCVIVVCSVGAGVGGAVWMDNSLAVDVPTMVSSTVLVTTGGGTRGEGLGLVLLSLLPA